MILLIDNYDSFTYNLVHFLGELGAKTNVQRNNAISASKALAKKPQAIIISPGPKTPNEAGISLNLIKTAAKHNIPTLGVCLGHQTIGQAFGAKITRAIPTHGKISAINHNSKGVFQKLPSPLQATRYHSLIIEENTLPQCLAITARTSDGTIMGIQHKTLNAHGVQFHPESIETEHGHKILQNFLKLAGITGIKK